MRCHADSATYSMWRPGCTCGSETPSAGSTFLWCEERWLQRGLVSGREKRLLNVTLRRNTRWQKVCVCVWAGDWLGCVWWPGQSVETERKDAAAGVRIHAAPCWTHSPRAGVDLSNNDSDSKYIVTIAVSYSLIPVLMQVHMPMPLHSSSDEYCCSATVQS